MALAFILAILALLLVLYQRRRNLLSLYWPSGMEPPQICARCRAFLAKQNIKTVGIGGGSEIDFLIPFNQYWPHFGNLYFICRDEKYLVGEGAFRNIRDWSTLSRERGIAILLTPSPLSPIVEGTGACYNIPVLHSSDLQDLASAIKTSQPQRPIQYSGRSKLLKSLLETEVASCAQIGQLQAAAIAAESSGDLATAESKWRKMDQLYGQTWAIHLSKVLEKQGKYEEAEKALSELKDKFPDDVGVAIAIAELSERLSGGPTATSPWDHFIGRFPELWLGYDRKLSVLVEVDRLCEATTLLRQNLQFFRSDRQALKAIFGWARRLDDWSTAQEACENWLRLERKSPLPYLALVESAVQQQKVELAQKVINSALKRFPSDIEVVRQARELGRTSALRFGIFNRARSYITRVAHGEEPATAMAVSRPERTPPPETTSQGVAKFNMENDHVAAEGGDAVLEQSSSECQAFVEYLRSELSGYQSPTNFGSSVTLDESIFMDSSRLTELAKSLEGKEREDLIQKICNRILILDDQNLYAYSALYDSLVGQGHFLEAEACLSAGLRRHPNRHELVVKQCRFATLQHDYERAAQLWKKARELHPNIEEIYRMGAFCFMKSQDALGATQLLTDGINENPNSAEIWLLLIEHLILSDRLKEASEQWQKCYALHNGNYRVAIIGAKIFLQSNDGAAARRLLSISHQSSSESFPGEHTQLQEELRRLELRTMLLNFESLGGRMEGCEFGLVQREFGAEPVGLLRWANMSPESLAEALERKFEGVGEPETTNLLPPHEAGADWTTSDTNFGMEMHTFDYDPYTEVSFEKKYKATCRRLKFLKHKLLQDISGGDKIFVFKVTYEVLCQQRLERIHRALNQIGPSTLLYVCEPDSTHPADTVEWIAPRLLKGYIGRFSFEFGHGGKPIGRATSCWIKIVEKAYDMWNAEVRQIGNGTEPRSQLRLSVISP